MDTDLTMWYGFVFGLVGLLVVIFGYYLFKFEWQQNQPNKKGFRMLPPFLQNLWQVDGDYELCAGTLGVLSYPEPDGKKTSWLFSSLKGNIPVSYNPADLVQTTPIGVFPIKLKYLPNREQNVENELKDLVLAHQQQSLIAIHTEGDAFVDKNIERVAKLAKTSKNETKEANK